MNEQEAEYWSDVRKFCRGVVKRLQIVQTRKGPMRKTP
jgi:hypothetical protein